MNVNVKAQNGNIRTEPKIVCISTKKPKKKRIEIGLSSYEKFSLQ